MSEHDAPGVIMEEPVPAAAKPVPKSRAVWIAVAVIVVIVVVLLAAALGGLFNPAAPATPALRIGTLLSVRDVAGVVEPRTDRWLLLPTRAFGRSSGRRRGPLAIRLWRSYSVLPVR